MSRNEQESIIAEYMAFIENKPFPCIAAKAAMAKNQISCFVADHMACPKDDHAILQFIYNFVDTYRDSADFYHSAVVIFAQPTAIPEQAFEGLLWERLQALANLDAVNHQYDQRVSADPNDNNFSFSLKEEAFYVIGLNASSSRPARQFKYPALVFNPHAQFEALRENGKYDSMKQAVRKRDMAFSGSVNPMLVDFGEQSETFQYSGVKHDQSWRCPLHIKHGRT